MGGGRNIRIGIVLVYSYFLFLTMEMSDSSNSFLSLKPEDTSDRNLSRTSAIDYSHRCLSSNENFIPFCLPLCCHWNHILINNTCVMANKTAKFPPVYDADSFDLTDLIVDETNFRFFVHDPCNGISIADSSRCLMEDEFLLLQNGSIYILNQTIINQVDYCFGIYKRDQYEVIECCTYADEGSFNGRLKRFFIICLIISLLFLFITFVIYSIIPELNNMHGRTLRVYTSTLFFAYLFLVIVQTSSEDIISSTWCIVIAFFMYFFFLASFYWLNVMCFDIWWTFGGFRALRGSMKQRDQKKFIIYSIYAWGVASLFTGICLIMDFAPNIPEGSIRPQLGAERCWFKYNTATNIYFIGPMTISVFCNLCLFISTALKIQQHKRDTAHHLRSSESRRHDDNKQWFNLYLKLFIVMGITWSTEIISTLWKGSDNYIWYITDVVNTLQGLIIFITLVCKEKIKRLLLKRFGYNDNKFFSRNSTRSVYHSSASRTTCTTSSGLPLQDKVNANIRREPFGTSKESAEESDCP
uniref:G-protein coupled receptor Mth2-like isoform X3 n=1 Tax=Vespula vulgaris TaxID=7454 RepID=UPI00223BC836|nr:G-protein coupled receptor Mth2-like isoform X3 [Vespula vulgaris]